MLDSRDRVARRVSRETLTLLDRYVAFLLKWNSRINLVSKTSVGDLWARHILDSAQFAWLAPPSARRWADIGSGAGLPGLVVAICLRESTPLARVTLIEKDERKAAFLSEVVAHLGLDAHVLRTRLVPDDPSPLVTGFDVVSARALAPLTELLALSTPLMSPDAVCLFAKGRTVASEIEAANRLWRMNLLSFESETEAGSVILNLKGLQRV